MLGTSARLLRLLSLFQAQRYWSGADLAARLEVEPRTLRRDVDRLRSLGYPVHSTTGVAGGYQLGAGSSLPPLLLDDEEAVAVALSLRTAASGSVAGIEEASVRALAKLDQVLPSRLRRRVGALTSFIEPLAPAGPTVDAARLAAIAGACRDYECLRFQYDARDRQSTTREVEPHRLVHTGRRWYLVAWDLGRSDWRTFRIDRIASNPKARARFVPRAAPEGGFAAYVQRSLAISAYPKHAEIVLHASAAQIAERLPPGAGLIEPISATTCLLRAGFHTVEMVPVYVAMLGVEFEVRGPAELKEHLQKLAAVFLRAAGD